MGSMKAKSVFTSLSKSLVDLPVSEMSASRVLLYRGNEVSSWRVCPFISRVRWSYFLFLGFPLKMSQHAVLASILLAVVALEEKLKMWKIREIRAVNGCMICRQEKLVAPFRSEQSPIFRVDE
jgi:hypothetical protein